MKKTPWTHFLEFISLTPNIAVAGISIYYSPAHTAIRDLRYRYHHWKAWGISVTAGWCWGAPQGGVWGHSQRGAGCFPCRRAAGAEPRQQQEPQVCQQPEEQQTAEGEHERHVPRWWRVQVLPFRHNSQARLLKQDRKSSSRLHTGTNIAFHPAELLHWGTRPELAPGLCRWWAEGGGGRQGFIPCACLLTAKATQMAGMDYWVPGSTKGRWNEALHKAKTWFQIMLQYLILKQTCRGGA